MDNSSLTTARLQDVLAEMELHLLEPQDGGIAFASGMWGQADAINSLMATYSAFVAKTRTRAFLKGLHVVGGQYRYDLSLIDDGLVDILRVGWGSVLSLQHVYVEAPGVASAVNLYTCWAMVQANGSNSGTITVCGLNLSPGSSIVMRTDGGADDATMAINLADISVGGDPGDGANVLYWIHDKTESPALHREDTFPYDQIRPDWKLSTSTPQSYSLVTQPLGYMDLMPSPALDAGLNIWYTSIPEGLVDHESAMSGISPEFSYHIKYGALAMLLGNEGPGNDPQRAEYFDQRLQEGIELAQMLCNEEY